jgi:indoleamine 2,3-dioxygenase
MFQLPIIPTDSLNTSEVMLRRAHLVLTWIMQFYIHSLPPDTPVRIPPPITIPLHFVSDQLQLPLVYTYSDCVLYNWSLKDPTAQDPDSAAPSPDNLRCMTLFTGTSDEEAFFLCTARIELRGADALELMRASMDEMFVGDALAVQRVASYLTALAPIIHDITSLLLSLRAECDPTVFNSRIRPWLCGADSDPGRPRWVFDGLPPGISQPVELSGGSAGQSSLIHALDIFLGVNKYSHAKCTMGRSIQAGCPASASKEDTEQSRPFLMRMRSYMPRHHRNFLAHLSAAPRPLREFVLASDDATLHEAYYGAIDALKRFRDAHLRIVAIYIIGPAHGCAAAAQSNSSHPIRGTGGSDLITFLKQIRDQTAQAKLLGQKEMRFLHW